MGLFKVGAGVQMAPSSGGGDWGHEQRPTLAKAWGHQSCAAEKAFCAAASLTPAKSVSTTQRTIARKPTNVSWPCRFLSGCFATIASSSCVWRREAITPRDLTTRTKVEGEMPASTWVMLAMADLAVFGAPPLTAWLPSRSRRDHSSKMSLNCFTSLQEKRSSLAVRSVRSSTSRSRRSSNSRISCTKSQYPSRSSFAPPMLGIPALRAAARALSKSASTVNWSSRVSHCTLRSSSNARISLWSSVPSGSESYFTKRHRSSDSSCSEKPA
mmetsp:Transcript_84135/g.238398  ORF Transcript_84135/g.238398 Transcript_84135/m.238398 type:complete len:270 (-) Transcript_84135:1589-2398(-)